MYGIIANDGRLILNKRKLPGYKEVFYEDYSERFDPETQYVEEGEIEEKPDGTLFVHVNVKEVEQQEESEIEDGGIEGAAE